MCLAGLLTGTLCFKLIFSESNDSGDHRLNTPKKANTHSASLYKETELRWFRRYGIDNAWRYGIVPAADATNDADIYEVSNRDPNTTVSDQARTFADNFRSAVMEAAYSNGWDDVSKATSDGYSNGPPFDFLHYVNFENTRDTDVLNPQKPEFLMYYPTSSGQVLAGAMFLTEKLYDQGPQPGGADMIWHYHTSDQAFCFRNNVMVEFEDDDSCNGIISRRSPEMLHVWFVEHPQGYYSTEMCLPAGIIEGWDGRKTWEEERARRFDRHIRQLRDKKFTLPEY